jgi:hypothetical protein
MRTPDNQTGPKVYSLLLTLLMLTLFASPFPATWYGFQFAWYLPYVMWGSVILVAALLLGHNHSDDH